MASASSLIFVPERSSDFESRHPLKGLEARVRHRQTGQFQAVEIGHERRWDSPASVTLVRPMRSLRRLVRGARRANP